MWQTLAVVVFVAVLVGAFFPRARVRAVAQLFGGALFVLSSLAAVAMVVGAVVLESRGGGVLILGAIVPGIVAWISGSLFFASRRYGARRRRPVDEQQRETLSGFEATLDGALQRLAALRAERARIFDQRRTARRDRPRHRARAVHARAAAEVAASPRGPAELRTGGPGPRRLNGCRRRRRKWPESACFRHRSQARP